ncbi:salicylate synthase [Streptomyces chartreusis]|uniref:salicylate synthase n=1 Tax=Streptomyces chartreusis TaxID=1969 RepID=UPI003801F07A
MTIPTPVSESASTAAWEPLTTPDAVRQLVPRTTAAATTVERARTEIRQVLTRTDDRLLVIVGPCSVHDPEAAIEYAGRLRKIADSLSGELLIVMRTYVEKPRTVLGWPGLAAAPDLNGPPDPERGFRLARSLMAEICGMGVPVATEWLTTVAPAYLADLVAWGCIGARTVESQIHRQLASWLPMPIGMKNRTDGAVQPAVDAIRAAAQSHGFLGVSPSGATALLRSVGNNDCHLVLRGGADGPNYDLAAIEGAERLLDTAGLPERLLIDASHGNSAKDHERQAAVALDIAGQVRAGVRAIRGVMLESFLAAGRQVPMPGRPLVRGQSITDACMGWPTTAAVLTELATAANDRRRRAASRARRAMPVPTTDTTIKVAPVASAVALATSGLFDDYLVYEREGVWTVAGGNRATVTVGKDRIRLRHRGTERSCTWRSQPLRLLGEVLGDLPIPRWNAYGWVAFEAAHLLAGGSPERASNSELARLIIPDVEVRIDADGVAITGGDRILRTRIGDILANIRPDTITVPTIVEPDLKSEWYVEAVADAVREIHGGSLQKVVLSRRVAIDAAIDLPQTYLLGRQANSPARSFLFDMDGRQATGFCPETILEVAPGGRVSTQPLAGTRSLGNGEDVDRCLRAELQKDPKELYEHVLALQAAFEELKSVCKPETVAASDLMSVVERGRLQHLASRVQGELADGMTSWDALEAVFPAVAASGIPKQPACDYISRVEKHARGLYSGAVLTASHDGALDAGLVLRSIYGENGRYWLQAGAGIVGTSRPEREYEETCEKLRSVAPYLVPESIPQRSKQWKRAR